MTIKDEIEALFDNIKHQWLEDYATTPCEKKPMQEYSNEDWKAATQYAKEKLQSALDFINKKY